MDHPLRSTTIGKDTSGPTPILFKEQDETEIILFSRPKNLIPTNPFAVIENDPNLDFKIETGNQNPGQKKAFEVVPVPVPVPGLDGTSKRNRKTRKEINFLDDITSSDEEDDDDESDIEWDKNHGSRINQIIVYGPTTVPNNNLNGTIMSNSISKGLNSKDVLYFDKKFYTTQFQDSSSSDNMKYQNLPVTKTTNLNSTTTTTAIPSTPGDKTRSSSTRPSFDTGSEVFNISSQNSTGVRIEDVIFSSIIFLAHILSFIIDFTLMCWYYLDEGGSYNFKWCSALTFFMLVIGSIGTLHQFNQAEKERLDRLFHYGRRVQIAVNSFPPLGTILCSYYCVKSGWKAKSQQIFSVHFFAIEEFSQSLSRIQGFFQSAPQATLQLVILMETTNDITVGKGILTITSVILSLVVMTIANLPGRSDMVETSVRKGIYSPVSRVFLGIRMISSFGSRTMGITFFLLGLRCVFGYPSTTISIVFGLGAIIIPRLIFTLIDYCYHRQRIRRGREAHTGHFGRLSFCGTCTGYLATIFFPMSHPLWVFWFIWIETGVFVLWGFVSIISSNEEKSISCVSNLVNFIYTGVFLIVFIVIPFLLPYARETVKRKRSKRLQQMFAEREKGVTNLQHQVTETV